MTSLVELCLTSLAVNIEKQKDISKLPDELTLLLWQIVLERNKLTPKALRLFLATSNPLTLRRIEAMKLRDPPPIIRADGAWINKPALY